MATVYKLKFDNVVFEYDSGKIHELYFLKSHVYNTIGRVAKELESKEILYTDHWLADVRKYAVEKIATFKTMQELVDFIVAMRFICIDQYESYYDKPAVIKVVLPNEEWAEDKNILKLTFWNTALNLILEKGNLQKVCLVQHCDYKLTRTARSYAGDKYFESLHIFDWQDVKKTDKYKKRFSKKKKTEENNKKEE